MFKYEVRRLHRHQCHLKRENLAYALTHSTSQEFWKRVKSISKSSRGSPASPAANIVDGCCDDGEIANLFSSNLMPLLNSCPDPDHCKNLFSTLVSMVSSVRDTISQLKLGKRDVYVQPLYHR